MSRIAKAETALVEKLEESRCQAQAIQAAKTKYVKSEEKSESAGQSMKRLKPPKPPAENDEDARDVLNLEVPRFDSTRKFEGIERQKMAKKDRHMKALDEFSQTLETVSEDIEQKVLALSRDVREHLEEFDEKLRLKYKSLTEDDYLIAKSKDELDDDLQYLKTTTAQRSAAVENFAGDLEEIECTRASLVGGKIRDLVDLLVGIAHQLPDEIEHIVEAESFDLNAVVTANRNSHAELLGMMRSKQIEIDIIALHNWDVAKQQWRMLKHNQSISIFHNDITSSTFTSPVDRQVFMEKFRCDQKERHKIRQNLIDELSSFTAESIASTEVQRIKDSLMELNEQEISATIDCYDGLSTLRTSLRSLAENRMEELRKELHVFGALHPEPDLGLLSDKIKGILNDEEITELFRLGGGLKPELAAVATELRSEDMVYEHLVSTVEIRLDLVSAGFPLKEVMDERGRLPRLDTIRTSLSKLRTVPRAEVAGVLTALLPDLQEMSGYDKMPATFLSILNECSDGIETELARIQENIDKGLGVPDRINSRQGSRGGSRGGESSTSRKGRNSPKKSNTATVKQTGTARNVVPEHIRLTTADPLLVKNWTRQLSMLCFASDFSDDYKEIIVGCASSIREVRICNKHVDAVVFEECDKKLNDIDQRYKYLIDLIANFLEVQANALAFSSNKITDFFASVAIIMEAHKAKQTSLDESSLDLLWDFSEENRLACEDREIEYENLCTVLRQSADMDELQVNFDNILQHLSKILECYRTYHGEACFLADKHPLSLVDDYSGHMDALCGLFEMEPVTPHLILETKRQMHLKNQRLNKKYMDSGDLLEDENEGIEEGDNEDEEEEEVMEEKHNGEEGKPDFENNDLDEDNDEDDDENILNTDDNGATTKVESPRASPRKDKTKTYVEKFTIPTPICKKNDPTAEEDTESVTLDNGAMICEYGLTNSFEDFITKFIVEEGTGDEEEEEKSDDDKERRVLRACSSEEVLSEDGSIEVKGQEDRVNKDYPWLIIRHYEPDAETREMITLKNDEELEQLGVYDLQCYEEDIAKHFVPRDDNEPFQVQLDNNSPDDEEEQEGEDEEISREKKLIALKEAYNKTLAIVARVEERKLKNNDPDYLLSKIPEDINGETFVSRMEISFVQVQSLMEGIRASLFTHLEQNCDVRIVDANILNKKRKSELTEELEDLLRTHWPRCGLVETQIKRPREVELLNHEEKTYRFILSIQEKMAKLQGLFDDTVEQTKGTCDKFRDDLASLLTVLTETQYKTLAALQGVEVKARAITQAFNTEGNGLLTSLRQMVAEDASAIIFYAKDFRKICPPQGEGISGGYSESELEDIAKLVEGQCGEISEVLENWKSVIKELDVLITEEASKHNTFAETFEQVANELALSQGLGQKYGAPRRRAQEKLRTEMSRDEKSAGFIDELLAMLEFQCSEAVGKSESCKRDESLINKLLQGKEISVSTRVSHRECGFEELEIVEHMWALAVRVRDSLHLRAKYLQVYSEETADEPPVLLWPPVFSRLPDPPGEYHSPKLHQIFDTTCLHTVVNDVEQTCMIETQELYKAEGKEEILAETEEGIPESLSIWLKETRHKILGPDGHHEKSWKRLWGQVDKFEVLLARKPGPMDQPQSKVGVPAACFRMLGLGYEQYISLHVDRKVEQFAKLLKVWEKGKEKHERLLRPRLGSPDAQDELEQLDAIESQRTEEVRIHVEQFQSSLITFIVKFSKIYCSDLGDCAKSFFHLMDSSLKLDLLKIPPDTEVPKKKITLKRLRKAQRVKEKVEQGHEDVSVERVWPSLVTDRLLSTLREVEGLVTLNDLQKLSPPPPVEEEDPKKPPAKKPAKKGKNESTEEDDVTPPPPPPMIPEDWVNEITNNSAVRAAVSTGHRLLVSERDASLESFTNHVGQSIAENRLYYGKILQQEESWCERWRSQVTMLKSGNM